MLVKTRSGDVGYSQSFNIDDKEHVWVYIEDNDATSMPICDLEVYISKSMLGWLPMSNAFHMGYLITDESKSYFYEPDFVK